MKLNLMGTAFFFLAASQAAAGPAPAVEIGQLGWMAGSWEGEDQGLRMEETWLAPRGGTLIGTHRDVKGTRTVSFEFLRIEAAADGITYWSNPNGRCPATPFRLVEASAKRVVFANPEHDFPKRILYWLDEVGALHARIEGEGKEKEKAMEWTWRRAGATP